MPKLKWQTQNNNNWLSCWTQNCLGHLTIWFIYDFKALTFRHSRFIWHLKLPVEHLKGIWTKARQGKAKTQETREAGSMPSYGVSSCNRTSFRIPRYRRVLPCPLSLTSTRPWVSFCHRPGSVLNQDWHSSYNSCPDESTSPFLTPFPLILLNEPSHPHSQPTLLVSYRW